MRGTWARILKLAKQQGVITPGDVRALGLTPENLNKMASLGLLVKAGRGIYEHPEFEWTENHSYVEVSKAIPRGVVCLLSALRIHEIGTQTPHEVWVAIPRGLRPPTRRSVRVRAVTMSGVNYELGIESHEFEGVAVKVYSLEKTIVDCFRLRRLIGHDVAVEALREALRSGKIDLIELDSLARNLRAERLLRPYIEAMI